jgi:hypothetical protein
MKLLAWLFIFIAFAIAGEALNTAKRVQAQIDYICDTNPQVCQRAETAMPL